MRLPDEKLKEELRSRHEIQLAEVEQQRKRQKVVDIARNIGVSIPKDPASIDESHVRIPASEKQQSISEPSHGWGDDLENFV